MPLEGSLIDLFITPFLVILGKIADVFIKFCIFKK